METQLATIEPKDIQARDNSPAALMIEALAKGGNLEQLEKFMELQGKWEANEARKAFFEAVAAFKENPPEVLKDKENSQFKSKYTTLGNLLKTVNPLLGKHGLSVSFTLSQAEKITVTCVLSHRMGHSESVSLSAPPDTSGGNSKNPIQQIKSTITYLRAATFEAVTGIAATDANLDDDGNGAGGVEYLTVDQQIEINDLIKETKANETQFLAYMKADAVATIPAGQYKTALAALNAKKKAVEKKS